MMKRILRFIMPILLVFCFNNSIFALDNRENESEQTQQQFKWWPTDAKPSPVKDETRDGYWWWPDKPGNVGPLWGNRGYCYVKKVIFDYKAEELPPAKPEELRPSLLIKRIIKNLKVYFGYNKAEIREDAALILEDAVRVLNRNPQSDILITGNCDIRSSESYNEKLGRRRAEAVQQFMLDRGISESHVRIISRGKLDAIAPVTDLVGMQRDRNAQFMIAEVEEVMIPSPELPQEVREGARVVDEGKYLIEKEEKIESQVKVSTKEYVVKKGDTLWKIADKELGSGYRWKYLYELNKDKIKDPNKLRVGKTIIIPLE
ncbi:MAG: OmpA family protein [Candidatus Omnitrophota bacterium]